MSTFVFAGVMPAITTPFDATGAIDHDAVRDSVARQVAAGATGIIPAGSLGEGSALGLDEKLGLVATVVESCGDRVPVVPAIAAASTAEAVSLAVEVEARGARGLMVLPPYVHSGDRREVLAHFATVFAASDLPCMLYNNPTAYGADLSADDVAALAVEYPNLRAVKESSGDVRRITALRERCGDRIAAFAGLDDLVVEAVRMGAVGWVAGLVNAFPHESVSLFERARADDPDVDRLYHWFLPLLRLDVVPDFVQRIKFVEEELGVGSARVRPPRLPLEDDVRSAISALVAHARRTNPF